MTIVVRNWTLTRTLPNGDKVTSVLHSATEDEVWKYAVACRNRTGDVYTYSVKI